MEVENGRMAKRKREGEVDPSAESPLVRSKIWFEDGNIVLQAGEVDPSAESPLVRSKIWFEDGNIVLQAGGIQFKVYRGLLAESSPVFADMFSIPQPLTNENLVEGCAVVHLTDSVSDVTFVLEALFQRKKPLAIEIVVAFVRMGNKYQIDDILNNALRRIYYEFPDTLQDYDDTEDWSTIECSATVNIDVVNLAREQNLLSVLPIALYCHHNSGFISRMDINCTSGLSSIDERALLKASLPLLHLQAKTSFSWLTNGGSSNCLTPDYCSKSRNHVLCSSFFFDPEWRGLNRWDDEWEDGMCGACIADAQGTYAAGRQQLWDQLPVLLGLPDWDELRKEKIPLEEEETYLMSMEELKAQHRGSCMSQVCEDVYRYVQVCNHFLTMASSRLWVVCSVECFVICLEGSL
ncbi:hypothetical protein HWV62_15877 [Athelia sp. TMB]|nr:hypothetical protein HWV62_15877 [Athelia sp. TMB]